MGHFDAQSRPVLLASGFKAIDSGVMDSTRRTITASDLDHPQRADAQADAKLDDSVNPVSANQAKEDTITVRLRKIGKMQVS